MMEHEEVPPGRLLTPERLRAIRPGDTIVRDLGGLPMRLVVSEVRGDVIACGPWTFSRRNGAEIDAELGWDERRSGSFIVGVEPKGG